MNICFVNQDMSIGGSSTVVHDLILNWPNKSDKLHLIVFFDHLDNRYNRLLNLNNLQIYFLHKSKKIDFRFLNLLKKTIFKIKPDVINSHLTSTFYLKLVKADKLCNIFHTIHSEPNKDLPFLYRLYLKKSIKKKSIKLIGCCEYISKKAITLYKTNVVTIRNGINIENDYSKVVHKKVNFIFIGRFVSLKNIDKIILAFNELNNSSAILRIIGDGELKNHIVSLVNSLNNQNILFIGKTSDVGYYLSQSDVLCLISKREGFPITILESIKYNLSFIVSNVGGISEIIKNNYNGIVIDSLDIDIIKKSMERMLNKNILSRFKTNNIELKKNINACTMAIKYEKMLKEK